MTRGTWTAPRFGPAARRAKYERPANSSLHFLVRYPPPVEERVTDSLGRDAKLARVEAALFLADDPVPARRLAEAAGPRGGRPVPALPPSVPLRSRSARLPPSYPSPVHEQCLN